MVRLAFVGNGTLQNVCTFYKTYHWEQCSESPDETGSIVFKKFGISLFEAPESGNINQSEIVELLKLPTKQEVS